MPPMSRPAWLQYPASVLFVVQMYVAMAVLGLLFLPIAIARREAAVAACRAYALYVRWTAAWMVGLTSEIRGPIPQGEVLVAAKHQSFFDILVIFSVLPQPKFVMKKELLMAPFIGWYAKRLGCVAVDRGKRGKAVAQMLADIAEGRSAPGQLVIYPQGTRVAPGAELPYKTGTAAIYRETGWACVPAATNVGVFWPKRGLLRRPGVAVVEFLPEIPPGVRMSEMMARIETVIETSSNALMAEAGFPLPAPAGHQAL
ncbi:lysophospholipid acyltransferase family protein [Frigidibacter sp. MR17.24]|uniref:lysophospholipid acyltransferase family protein n=1 Tax=Frigidibacter sp. MR17.24 TaxID=3127345 RepID=UPI003012EEC8